MDPIVYFSRTRLPTDGIQTIWEFSFASGYLSRDHVKAELRNPETGETGLPVTFTWIGNNQISITPAITAGMELLIYRDTPKEAALVEFTDGSIITSRNLDRNSLQWLYLAQESWDRATDTLQDINDATELAQASAELAVQAKELAEVSAALALAAQQDIHDNWQAKLDQAAQSAAAALASADAAAVSEDNSILSMYDAEASAIRAEAAADVATMDSPLYPDEPTGRAAVQNGDYFRTVGSGVTAFIVYQRVSPELSSTITTVLSSQANGLTLNVGKEFPFKNIVRAGALADPSTFGNNTFVDAAVYAPASMLAGKYIKVAYVGNGAEVGGIPGFGIRIEEFDAATYDTLGTATIIHTTADTPPAYNRAEGRLQKFTVRPVSRPGMRIDLTINTDTMPPTGTQIQMGAAAGSGYSLIIDPVCYHPEVNQAAEINMGADFPLKRMVRGGINSGVSRTANGVFLDIQVIGPAELLDTKYIKPAYLQNGAATGLPHDYGIRIEEFDRATYESTGAANIIHTTADTPADYDRTLGGIQEFTVIPAGRPQLRIKIKMNVDALPPFGTQLQMGSSTVNAYSWIVDPSCYVPVAAAGGGGSDLVAWHNPTYLVYTHATKSVDTVSRVGSNEMRRFSFRKNGHNSLPNPYGVASAAFGDPEFATFDQFNFNTSEWFGVMHIKAVNNGDGTPTRWATGGNHGPNGGGTGANTARNILHKVLIDGVELQEDFTGYVRSVQVHFSNELMAYNTVSLGRYVLRQTYWVNIVGNTCAVHAHFTALEDIYVQRDRAVQMSPAGYTGTVLFAGGSNTARIPVTNSVDSGPSSAYPNAWAMVMDGPYGQLAMWIDQDFGLATDRAARVAPTIPLFTGSKGTSPKVYSGIIESASNNSATPDSTALLMAPGDTYEWRGGYMWDKQLPVAGIDSILKLLVDQTVKSAVILPNGSYDKPTI